MPTTTGDNDDTLVDSTEAAAILGIHRSAFTRKVQMGRIRFVHRVGERGPMVFRRSDVEDLARAEGRTL